MDIMQVILGPVVTEKAERLKLEPKKKHVLRIAGKATKIDVKNALKKLYDVDVETVRVLRTLPKSRTIGRGRTMEKRHREKRAIVTLSSKSKNLDLSTVKS